MEPITLTYTGNISLYINKLTEDNLIAKGLKNCYILFKNKHQIWK